MSGRRRCNPRRLTRSHQPGNNKESSHRCNCNAADNGRYQPWFARRRIEILHRHSSVGRRSWSRHRTSCTRATSIQTRPDRALRSLLSCVCLYLPAYPFTRTAGVLRGQASINLVDLAEWVLLGCLFVHDFSLRSPCNLDRAIRIRLSTVSIELSVISAISPMLS